MLALTVINISCNGGSLGSGGSGSTRITMMVWMAIMAVTMMSGISKRMHGVV